MSSLTQRFGSVGSEDRGVVDVLQNDKKITQSVSPDCFVLGSANGLSLLTEFYLVLLIVYFVGSCIQSPPSTKIWTLGVDLPFTSSRAPTSGNGPFTGPWIPGAIDRL